VRYRRWRTVAFDGCSSTKAPDQPRVCAWFGKIRHRYGQDGYPMLRIMVLCETGTRALLGAVFGPVADGETIYAQRLLPLLDSSMLLLNDRGFGTDDFLAKIAATGAQLLVRLNNRRTPARWAHLPDGSYLTRINGVALRITVTTGAGTRHFAVPWPKPWNRRRGSTPTAPRSLSRWKPPGTRSSPPTAC
jgi:hypothetical protein